MDYNGFFKNHVSSLKTEGRYRVFADLERLSGDAPYATWHHEYGEEKVVVWCSNDYLGMSQHPEVIDAMAQAAKEYGAGSGGTRNISGTAHSHVLLEEEVANLHEKESGLVFTSGYCANETTISTLAMNIPGCVVVSDERNHASIIQGIRLSRAEKRVFAHNDMADLRVQLEELGRDTPKLIVMTSVYSMDGDIAKITDICDLAEEFNAMTFLDEVHAVGLYGSQGGGVAASLGIQERIDIIQGNFAKAYGVIGGYITGTSELVDFVRSAAPGFIFTTSLPPAVAEAARTSIKILRSDGKYRSELWDRVQYLKDQLSKTHLPFLASESHIVPIIVGEANRCREVTDRLIRDYKMYVQPINYPTVPKGLERLRLTVTPAHTHEMIDDLVNALSEIWEEMQLKAAA